MDLKLSHCLRGLNLHGVQLAPEEFCDALWLTALGFVEGQSRIIPPTPQRQDVSQPSSNPPAAHPDQTSAPLQPPPSHSVHALGGSGERTMRGSLLSLPATPAIANGIEYDRAFKPLRQRRVIARTVELDEEATVTAIAETGIWQIIMRPARGRWLDIVVVVEQSPTMRIWQETAREFRQLLWRTCGPRSLRTFHVEWLSKRLRVHTSGGRQVSNQSPAQGQGRRLILVLSDAMSFGWLTADIPELLAKWARSQTTTLVQMLPEAMWRRTALRQVLPAPGKESSPSADASPDQWAQVTLTTLEPDGLRRYARDLVGVTKESVASFRGSRAQFQMISPQTVEEKKPFDPQSLSADEIEKIFRRFEAFSSPGAKRLARYLASAPLVLPVMRLVQRVLVPDSAPSQLAEIFLSGIMFRQQTELGVQPQSNQLVYEFLPGIRERLIDLGGLDCLFATAELISEYVEKRLGKGGAFTALLEDPAAAAKEWSIAPSSAAKDEPFVRVAHMLLEHMGIAAPPHKSSSITGRTQDRFNGGGEAASIRRPKGEIPADVTTHEATPANRTRADALNRQPRVYISRTTAGLAALADEVTAILRERDIEVVSQTAFFPDWRTIQQMLQQQLVQCDAVIALIGPAHGSEPDFEPARLKDQRTHGRKFSFAQWEYLIARDLKRPVFTFLVSGPDLIAPFESESTELEQRQQQFITDFAKDSSSLYYAWTDRAKLLDQVRSLAFPRSALAAKPCNLPYGSIGTLFKGREQVIVELRESLTHDSAAVIKSRLAVHGLGGVGKTRTAIEYAWKHADDYNAILFITAETPTALYRNLAALCGPLVLNLPEQEEREESHQVEAALRWLGMNPGWLLIVDNVDTDEAATATKALLAKLTTGHVLITSRMGDWSGHIISLDLDVLSETSAVEFLDERTAERRLKTSTDAEDVKSIVRLLDCLVLALEEAGSHISTTRLSYSNYLSLLESHSPAAISWHDAKKMNYPKSLAITYETSLSQLSLGANELFRILSWFAPDPIPRSLFDSRSNPSDEIRHLRELEGFHLVRFLSDGKTFTIHRLTQEITRQKQNESNSTLLMAALEWINQGMPDDTSDVRAWPVAIPLTPHAITAATFGADRGIAEPSGKLLRCAAVLHYTQANYQAAEPLFRRALNLHEANYGNSHPEVSRDLFHLAQLLQTTNRLVEAEPLMRRALAIDEANSSGSQPDVARSLNNLASMLQATNRLTEAEPLIRRALAIDEMCYGPSHRAVATDLNNLSQLLQAANRHSEAEPLMRRALAIGENSLGPDHPEVARILSNYARLLQSVGRHSEAEPLMRRSLVIDEAAFGPKHPNVSRDIKVIADLLHETNNLSEAESLWRRAIAIDEGILGLEHPEVAIGLSNLALILKEAGRSEEALGLTKRAMRIFDVFTQTTGYSHPQLRALKENFDELQAASDSPSMEQGLSNIIANAVKVFSANPDQAIFVKDLSSRFIYANTVFAQSLGFQSVDSILGKSDADFFPAIDAKKFIEDDKTVISRSLELGGNNSMPFHETFVFPGRSPRVYVVHKKAVWGEDGAAIGTIGRLELNKSFDEDFQNLRDAIVGYARNTKRQRPLSVVVFGPSNSVQSDIVRAVCRETNAALNRDAPPLIFDLAKMKQPSELVGCFRRVVQENSNDHVPVVIFDSFDVALQGKDSGWLRYFLSPMQDGVFVDDGREIAIGRAIFAFCGAVNSSFREFAGRMNSPEFVSAKGPDFISRLQAHVDIAKVEIPSRATALRILISGPSDVSEERELAKRAVSQLQRGYGNEVSLWPVSWADMPLSATGSFEEGMDGLLQAPAGIDIAIFILWSRLGTQLGSPKRADGTPYRSGTEREFEMMLEARGASGHPTAILAYIRHDDEGFTERLRHTSAENATQILEQRTLVDQFVRQNFQDSERRNTRAYHSYRTPADFAERCEAHLKRIIDDLLSNDSPV